MLVDLRQRPEGGQKSSEGGLFRHVYCKTEVRFAKLSSDIDARNQHPEYCRTKSEG